MIKKWMQEAYNIGKHLQGKSYDEIINNSLAPDSYFFDFETNFFFECGYQGHNFPEYITGWRYGQIPESGRSYNYRDQIPEHGISLMQIDGQENTITDKISVLFISYQNRPIVKCAGFLNPMKTGTDGEPLIVCAEEITD